jgi:putative FmdB family regulatory protein
MPTYEYACAACGHEWEQQQRITEPPVELCPKCAASTAHRLISGGTHFILKGGGWYSDLYASPKAPSKETDKTGEAKTEGKEAKKEGTTETASKPDGKPATASSGPATPASPSTSSPPSSPSSSSPTS